MTSCDKCAALARAVMEYDAAIRSCANDPEKMSSFCTAAGDDLDRLYSRMIRRAGITESDALMEDDDVEQPK